MTDTAQALAPAETDRNAQLQDAADAFKAFDNPASVQPRAEDGKFASTEPPEETAEVEEEELEAAAADEGEADETEETEEEEAAEEAQPMPSSWPADKAETWNTLPAEAKAFIAERDAEQLRAVNAKFQESANARKEASLAAKEAQTRRNEYLTALETVEAIYKAPEPDPRAFGYGTQQYNETAFLTAHRQWRQTEQTLAQFKEQRDAVRKQAEEEDVRTFSEWKQQHEAEFAPKFLADVPDLKVAEKAEPLMRELVTYAIANGIPQETFAEDVQDQITSAQLHLLWKAKEFDKLRATKTAPKPKPAAGPAVRPGVSSPRSAQKAVRRQKDFERLGREGSIAAGAAAWKHFTS